MNPGSQTFLRLTNHPFKFRLFLLSKLPAAYFSGVRIRSVSENEAKVTIPYKWFSRNPFRSTYFACLSMAAEMSTGVLAMMNVYQRKPSISMLVTKVEGEFNKKSTGIATFTCADGQAISACIEKAVATGESQNIRALSTGTNSNGETIATFYITWSFKQKKSV